jgi:hypothetical protein
MTAAPSAQQEALKAEIRQLLKDVSAELKQLQAALTESPGQPPPEAGTGTDPELFGEPEALGSTSAAGGPLSLETDVAPTQRVRSGGGVAETAGEVTAATPQQKPEEAALAAQAREEAVALRRQVPPQYRGVLERLSRPTPSTTTEAAP